MRWLLLDLAGVLARFDPEHRLGRLAALSGLSPLGVRHLLWDSGVVASADSGGLDAAGVRSAVRDRLHLSCTDDEIDAAWASAFTTDPEVLAVLANTGPDPGHTGILTNNDALLATLLPATLPEVFARAAGGSFFAGAIGAAKPDPAAWRAVLSAWAVDEHHPREVCFVDDSPGHVRAAADIGLDAVLFHDPGQLAAELARRTVVTLEPAQVRR